MVKLIIDSAVCLRSLLKVLIVVLLLVNIIAEVECSMLNFSFVMSVILFCLHTWFAVIVCRLLTILGIISKVLNMVFEFVKMP